MDCLFCKIIAKEIPNYTVWEDENILAFLDIHPCSKGHTVVVSKKHFSDLLEMDDAAWQSVMHGVRQTAERLQKILKPHGMNIGINNGEAAGQAVPHTHWHIIPRYKNDGGGSMHSIVRAKDAGEILETAKLFLS